MFGNNNRATAKNDEGSLRWEEPRAIRLFESRETWAKLRSGLWLRCVGYAYLIEAMAVTMCWIFPSELRLPVRSLLIALLIPWFVHVTVVIIAFLQKYERRRWRLTEGRMISLPGVNDTWESLLGFAIKPEPGLAGSKLIVIRPRRRQWRTYRLYLPGGSLDDEIIAFIEKRVPLLDKEQLASRREEFEPPLSALRTTDLGAWFWLAVLCGFIAAVPIGWWMANEDCPRLAHKAFVMFLIGGPGLWASIWQWKKGRVRKLNDLVTLSLYLNLLSAMLSYALAVVVFLHFIGRIR